MLRSVLCWLFVFSVAMATVTEAKVNNWYFGGLSPGIFLDGKAKPVGHVFIGAEGVVWRCLGFSADVGYLAHVQSLGNGAGVLSVGGLFFPVQTAKRSVFISSGYTLGFQGGAGQGQRANFLHTGLGTRLGTHVRLEVRNYVNFDGADPNTYIWAFRVGWIF